MVHNVPTIPLHADSMAQVPFPSVSAPTPQRSAAAPSDSILQIKATRLARLFSSYTVEQCADVLRASNYDLGEAIEKLRPKKVARDHAPMLPTLRMSISQTKNSVISVADRMPVAK